MAAGVVLVSLAAAGAAGAATSSGAKASTADGASLPNVTSGHRPGPDILYSPPASAPQLENAPGSGWHASPLLVSGASAYVDGEYLYQGYLYGDHGGAGTLDPNDPYTSNFLFAAKTGTLTYPTGPSFANNAANLLELRVRPTPAATAIRVTLVSLANPDATAFTVAIGTSPASVAWPDNAGVKSPAALFLTVHGGTAQLVRAATGQIVSPAPQVTVDTARHQFDVLIPHAAWNPGPSTVRFAAGVGLWDASAGHYIVPGAVANATTPGGASPSGEALFDMAFRFDEPMPDWATMGDSFTLVDGAVVEQADQHCFWRDCDQGNALRTGDVSQFYSDINFAKLAGKVTDTSGVPTTGSIDRIMSSHFSYGQGVTGTSCGRFPVSCHGMFLGNLQPYNLYIPARPVPAAGWGLTLLLHASGGNYNEYMNSRNQSEFADRGAGYLVVTPLARDANCDYTDVCEADAFEDWADVASHYRLDPTRTALAGYSMGGGGTYKLAERWPDLFADAFAAAAVPYDHGLQGQWMQSLLNVPLMTWISVGDEGSPSLYQREQIAALESYRLRFTFDEFLEGDHVTLATNDQYAPAAAWLDNARVNTDPPGVDFAVDPDNDFPADGTVADHAYWLSRLTLRSTAVPAPSATSTVDNEVLGGVDPGAQAQGPAGVVTAWSYGFGVVKPASSVSEVPTPEVLSGGYHGPMPYLQTSETWKPTVPTSPRDRLVVTATNLSRIVVDIERAHLDCRATVQVTSDGPLTISFPACGTSLVFGPGTSSRPI